MLHRVGLYTFVSADPRGGVAHGPHFRSVFLPIFGTPYLFSHRAPRTRFMTEFSAIKKDPPYVFSHWFVGGAQASGPVSCLMVEKYVIRGYPPTFLRVSRLQRCALCAAWTRDIAWNGRRFCVDSSWIRRCFMCRLADRGLSWFFAVTPSRFYAGAINCNAVG